MTQIELDITITPNCDMLIGQNCYIGKDPIGHICYNKAVYQNETHFFCQECRDKLPINYKLEPMERVTIPELGSVIGWKERTEEMINNLMKPKEIKLPIYLKKYLS